jgi:hydroxyacylglutathione hydrolase
MILERSMHPTFLSNTYLVAARDGGEAFFVDAGGPMEPLFEAAERRDLTPTHVLLTHHHHDHVSEVGQILERWPDVEILIHPDERDQVPTATGTMDAGTTVRAGGLDVRTIHIPGHTDPSTVADEFDTNSFIRVWRGLDPEGDEACTAFGEPATLVLLGDDYDGGHKAWVRWPDGRDDIVPGSQVQRSA